MNVISIKSFALALMLILSGCNQEKDNHPEEEEEPETPVNILPVGDSITQGGKRDREEYTYRLPLQRILKDNNVSFDFIGSRQSGLHDDATWPDVSEGVPFDPDHEGYYGNKTRNVVNKVMAAFPEYEEMPDIVLIHLGTNDQSSDDYVESVGKPLREFISFLRDKNPEVVTLLGHLNFDDGEAAEGIREVVEKVATDMDTPESPVKTVHHYQDFKANPKMEGSDTYDWAHPNPQGQEKMARKWYDAMQPYL